jgi:hypothetical protein
VEDCRAFFSTTCPENGRTQPVSALSHDVIMLSFCLAGMNMVDLYNLKKEDYNDGVISYIRAKSANYRSETLRFQIRVETIILPLIEKYKTNDTDPFLFNFHLRYNTADSFCTNVNGGIKQICKTLGLSTANYYNAYTFRYTWSAIAQSDCNATETETDFAMNNIRTAAKPSEIDFSFVWNLNAKVIDLVFNSTVKGSTLTKERIFRLSPKVLVHARAYYQGELVAEVKDIDLGNVKKIIEVLAPKLPSTIPNCAEVYFRIKNVDAGTEMVYVRTKGKGFN